MDQGTILLLVWPGRNFSGLYWHYEYIFPFHHLTSSCKVKGLLNGSTCRPHMTMSVHAGASISPSSMQDHFLDLLQN